LSCEGGNGCVRHQDRLFRFDEGSAMATENISAGKIGKYEIIRVLGRGGMGEVLLAQDVDLGRRVAIKRPFKSALDEGLARFQVEAKAATLRHPNIPAVYEMGVQDGLPFIAMEFVEGEALDKIINSGRELDLITKLRIIEQVCSALSYAHEKGIIHRDIKPANVIVQPDGVAKIIDFGIAKIQDGEGKAGLTQTSAVIGSLHYIAPERFKGGAIDGRVDIFSAGVTLFKLLTGTEPFTGGEATAAYKIVNEAYTPLGDYLHDYPPALDEIVAKSLAKNREDRYSTGEDFADALHEVIEDLKRTRVSELFDDAERLTTESRFTPALELLEEAVRLDPSNTQVRKLRKFVREHQDRIKRAERLRECIIRADEALLSGNFDEALTQLRDAQSLDAFSGDLRLRIQSVEDKKRRYEISLRLLAEAESARNRGDIVAAQRIVAKGLQENPENQKLLVLNGVLARQAEIETQRGRILELLDMARGQLAARDLTTADKHLREAESIDPSNPETDKLRREWVKVREQEQRRVILEEIQTRVNDFLRTESYDQAADLVNRAIDKLPNETALHRLKAEVTTEARKFEQKRLVDGAISEARDLFARSPLEGLAVLQRALKQVPGEERLIAYERSLRQQMDTLRVEQVRTDTLLKSQELMAGKEFRKAIDILESFQLEFGNHPGVDDLLAYAREEQAKLQRSEIISRCTSEGNALIRDGRLEDASSLLEYGIQKTGDASLSRLLEEVREQQAAAVRKIEVLQKRVELLRERGEIEEAVKILRQEMAALPVLPVLQELLTSLQAEHEEKQIIGKAISAARAAARKNDFSVGLESLQAVVRAYGESAELTHEIQKLEAERSSYGREIVGRSIDSARDALFKNDPQGALAALKNATPWMEFADAKKQADWQRIGQSVKKALERSGTSASAGAAFDAQLSAIATAKPRKLPIWIVPTAGLALVAVVAIVVWNMRRPSSPPPPSEAHFRFAVSPVDAVISIDGTAIPTNPPGRLTFSVKPGTTHHIVVSKTGYLPFEDDLTPMRGEDVPGPLILSPLPPSDSAGYLVPIPQGDLGKVRVFIDGKNFGTKAAGEKISLGEGPHTVKYAWPPDYTDSKEHTVTIAKGKELQDRFILDKYVPPPPSTGRLTIHTNGGAQISVDGQFKGTADSTGSYWIDLSPSPHTVNVSLDKFQAATKPVTIAGGRAQTVDVELSPIVVAQPSGKLTLSSSVIEKGSPVQLAWDVKNASTVSIPGLGDGLRFQGNQKDYPDHTTKYQLIGNGTVLDEQTVTVNEPKQAAVIATPVVNNPAPARPTLPDQAALTPALVAYESLYTQASGKSKKECEAVFNSKYQGRLKDYAGWCDDAKSFEVKEQCNQQVGGSPDAPTLTCAENITIYLKSGDPQRSHPQKTFRFSKIPDGWQLTGW